jgi:UDP-glucose 4-epimerase
MKVLLTGGTGFFGSILKKYWSEKDIQYINFDIFIDPADSKKGIMFQGDLCKPENIQECFQRHGPFDAVVHVAAQLAHNVQSKELLWESNVTGTQNIVEASSAQRIPKFIFTSTNCLWGAPLNRPVREDDPPKPIETYGFSKWEAEKILKKYQDRMNVIIFRSPTIIEAGRLGLLALLFDFIYENRRIPVVGSDRKPYQFIDANDYAKAITSALNSYQSSGLFNVGSDHSTSLGESFQYVIDRARSTSKLYHVPKAPTVLVLKLLHKLHLSPLGPYHYRMIAEEFVFDTARIKKELQWFPTKTNGEMLFAAYEFYKECRDQKMKWDENTPAHKKPSSMGLIRVLKWFS